MDHNEFAKSKEAGNLTVTRCDVTDKNGVFVRKHEDAVLVTVKKFDPMTGNETDPLTTELSIKETTEKRDACKAALANLEAMLSALKAS